MGHNTTACKSSKLAIHFALSPFCCASTSMNRINSLLVAEFFGLLKDKSENMMGMQNVSSMFNSRCKIACIPFNALRAMRGKESFSIRE